VSEKRRQLSDDLWGLWLGAYNLHHFSLSFTISQPPTVFYKHRSALDPPAFALQIVVPIFDFTDIEKPTSGNRR
jgi:hypothetical protein